MSSWARQKLENSHALAQEFRNLDSIFDGKFLKLNHATRLLKSVIHTRKVSKKFGMGLSALYKTMNIIWREYFRAFLESEQSRKGTNR